MNNNSKKIFKISFFLLGFVVILSCGINSTFAATSSSIYVSTHGNDSWNGLNSTYIDGLNGPKATIKNAVGTLNTNGTVYIASGTYNESNIQINSNMNIIGESQKNTIINGQKSKISIFTIASGINVTISNLSLINSTIQGGGGSAIYNRGTLTVNNSTFTNNTVMNSVSEVGGAIYNGAGTLAVNNCTFTNNTVTNGVIVFGGAIYNVVGTLTVDNSTFTNNTAQEGGAIYNEMGTLTVDNSTFTNNTAQEGGAIFNHGTATANFNRITGNTASIGSAIFSNGTMDARYNWWGSNADPSSNVNSYVNVTPWMVLTITPTSNILPNNVNSNIIVDLLHDSNGIIHDPVHGQIPEGILVNFNTTLGTVDPLSTIDVTAESSLNSGSKAGLATVSATLDNQTIQTLVRILDTISPTSNVNLINGTYNSTQTVSLNMSEPGTIYYTTDGTTPTYNSNRYISPINITNTTTLQYFAMDIAGNTSPLYTNIYTVDVILPTASANLPSGFYNTAKTVSLNMSELGTIYYTLNGTTPTAKSSLYTKPITITSTTTLKYLAIDLAGNKSPIYTQTYTIDKIPPKITTTTPTNNKTNVSKTSPIVIKFSENIQASTNFNKITVKNLKTGKYTTISKTIRGNTLNIQTSTKNKGTWYLVTIPKTAIKDYSGNNFITTYTFRFKT